MKFCKKIGSKYFFYLQVKLKNVHKKITEISNAINFIRVYLE